MLNAPRSLFRAFTRAVPPRVLWQRWLSVFCISLIIISLALFAYLRQPRLARMLDHKVYDSFLELFGNKEITDIPVIIDLDEASLERFGQWPWPRFLLAELLYRLAAEGVAAVGVDVLLIEDDRSSPRHIQADLKRFLDLNVDFIDLPEQFRDYDALLAEMLPHLPAVLGMYLHFDGAPGANGAAESATLPGAPLPGFAPIPGVTVVTQRNPGAGDTPHALLRAHSASAPLPAFRSAAPLGLLNMNPDEDGVVRRMPLLAEYQGKIYASLSLRALMRAENIRNLVMIHGRHGLEAIKLGPHTIPLSNEGHFTIPFRGPGRSYPYYSAADVLTGAIPEGALKGRIAFLGTSAAGLLDIRVTPLDRVYPGVEVHASVLDAILQQDYLHVPPWTPGLQPLAIVVCGIIAALAFGFARPRVYVMVGAALLGSTLYASIRLFQSGYVVSPLYVMSTIVLLGATLLLLRFLQEERQKNVLRSAFSRYVAPEVVARITKMQGDLFAGEEVEATIMFTDIRRFTTISESLRPEQVVSFLNRYFTPMTALVRGNKGTLDKFIGDALMAFWNAPVPVPGHPALALKTALAMQNELAAMNAALQSDFGHEVRMGVGVHTGKVFVGNMGSEELLNYTIIGDSVNLASRLEGLCSQYGAGVITSAETRAQSMLIEPEAFAFQQLDRLRVKGKTLPVDVYAVFSSEEEAARAPELEAWQRAFTAYLDGDFTASLRLIEALLEEHPATQLYRVYAQRCRALLDSPPAHWDGVWVMTSK